MRRLPIATIAGLLLATSPWAQNRAPIPNPSANEPQGITIPAGTRIPLSLIIPIHTNLARRGDVVHLETRYPVIVGIEIAIPAGTYVEGVIDKITKRDRTGSPPAGLHMHFTRLRFNNGYEVRLDGAILQAVVGVSPYIDADISEHVEFAEPAIFVHSSYLTDSDPWKFGPSRLQAQHKPPKPPKPPKNPNPPDPNPPPAPSPPPTPNPPPSPAPPPVPTPNPPPTPTPPTLPTPTPSPVPSPTISAPGSSMGAAVGIGIGAVAAVVGGVLVARHRGADIVIEEGTQFYMVLQTSLSLGRQAAAGMMAQ